MKIYIRSSFIDIWLTYSKILASHVYEHGYGENILSLSRFNEKLNLQNVADIKKLQSVGICTIKGIIMTTKKRLYDVKGLSEAKVDKIKEIAAKLTVSQSFISSYFFSYPFSRRIFYFIIFVENWFCNRARSM